MHDNNMDDSNTINTDIIKGFENIGILIPKILLPAKNVDMKSWSVVACDQYTSQNAYWETVEKLVMNKPSTLNMILPEIYLERPDVGIRIKRINDVMKKYLDENVLLKERAGFIDVNRKTIDAQSRKGLIVALDLEKYDYNKGSQTLIRATEGTVVERLPPRIKIRKDAMIELPHIMVLIDDPEKRVIEPLEWKATQNHSPLRKVYDFDLMMNGGHVKGYKIEDENILRQILEALTKLSTKEVFEKKYGLKVSDKRGPKDAENTGGILLYAMGDGNHSLAAAKAVWEEKKKQLRVEEQKDHPARYALVELVNVHDAGLKFKPIHRVLFNVDKNIFVEMKRFYNDMGSGFDYWLDSDTTEKDSNTGKDVKTGQENKEYYVHKIRFVMGKESGVLIIKNPISNLEVGTLQAFLDYYIKNHKQSRIDYIHGDKTAEGFSRQENNIGFILPIISKTELFRTVVLDGVLPRKTFSMGEAEEKRFYLEARRII